MIAEIVGHSDVNTTLAVYTHPSLKEKTIALATVAEKLLPADLRSTSRI
jgi:integrase